MIGKALACVIGCLTFLAWGVALGHNMAKRGCVDVDQANVLVLE